MKKDFDFYYNLYINGNEELYDSLDIHTIKELERACDSDLAMYYDFKCWLIGMEEYYLDKKMNPEYL